MNDVDPKPLENEILIDIPKIMSQITRIREYVKKSAVYQCLINTKICLS